MPEFGQRNSIRLAAGLIAVVIGLAFYFNLYRNAPPPAHLTNPIAAGGVARFIVTPKASGIRGGRYSPHHLEFASTAGPVDIYVLPANPAHRKKDWDEITRLTDEFAAGQVPQGVVAKSAGKRGRIDLAGWSQHFLSRKRHSYLVLVRSDTQTEVSLVVHYRP